MSLRARVVVFGNEKGGSGKSTAAMHVAVGLMRKGLSVATVDLDARQGTLSRYVQNRRARAAQEPALPLPQHHALLPSTLDSRAEAEADERARFGAMMAELAPAHDIVVIDTPGAHTHLNRLGHSHADILVTPINDSFVDLDLLATVDPETHAVVKPSIYSEMVWEQRKARALRDRGSVDWIVMRNRLAHLDARNKREIATILERLARRIGFRTAPGFGERVIFRELFLKGLTLLDLAENGGGDTALTLSHVAARQEVRTLLDAVMAPPVQAGRAVRHAEP